MSETAKLIKLIVNERGLLDAAFQSLNLKTSRTVWGFPRPIETFSDVQNTNPEGCRERLAFSNFRIIVVIEKLLRQELRVGMVEFTAAVFQEYFMDLIGNIVWNASRRSNGGETPASNSSQHAPNKVLPTAVSEKGKIRRFTPVISLAVVVLLLDK